MTPTLDPRPPPGLPVDEEPTISTDVVQIDLSEYYYKKSEKSDDDKKKKKKKKTMLQVSVSYWTIALSVFALYYLITRSGQNNNSNAARGNDPLSENIDLLPYSYEQEIEEPNMVTQIWQHFRKNRMMKKLGIENSETDKNFRSQYGRASSSQSSNNSTDEDLQLYSFSECFHYVTKGEFNQEKLPNDTDLIDTLMEGAPIINVTADLLFIFCTLLLGWLLRLIFINYHSPLPFTVALMILGIILSFLIQMFSCFSGPNIFQSMINFVDIENLNGHRILFVFLPVLLFESAYDIDSHLFFRAIKPILLLAIPGLILSSFMSAFIADISFRSFGQMALAMKAPEIRLPLTLTFGSLISATDPVAVVALLKEIGGSKILGTMIEGEALLNDGAAIVLYSIALGLTGITENSFTSSHGSHGASHGDVTNSTLSHRNVIPMNNADTTYEEMFAQYRAETSSNNATAVDPTYVIPPMDNVWLLITKAIFQKTIFPVFYGLVFAKISSKLLYTIFDDMLSEVSFPLIMCYITYYFSEMMSGSGVLTCVFFGLFLEKNSICTEHHEFLHKFFQMLAYISNTLIFFLVGLVVSSEFLGGSGTGIEGAQTTGQKLLRSFWYYIYITFVRFVSISIFSFFTKNQGVFSIGFNEVVVMTWGGLRGAVSLCLALNLLAAKDAPDFYKEVADDILICTAMVVFMTLFINAMSVKGLLQKLGMLDISASMHATMTVAIDNLAEDTSRSIVTFRFDPFLADARWSEVNKRTSIEYPYDYKPTEEELIKQLTEGQDEEKMYDSEGNSIVDEDEFCPQSAPKTLKDMNPESVADSTYRLVKENAIKRALKSLKMNIGKQFAEGTISQEVYNVLETAINKGVDSNRFVDRDDLKKNWEIGPLLAKIKSVIEGIMFDERVKKEVCPHTKKTGPFRKPLIRLYFWLTRSNTFDNIFQAVVLLNIPFIIAEFVMGDDIEEEVFKTFLYINVGFFILYFIEFLVKIIGLTPINYFSNGWCMFDFIILLISFVDVVVLVGGELTNMYCQREENSQTDFCLNTADDEDESGGSMVDNVLKVLKSFKLMKASRAIKVLKVLRAFRALKFLKTVFPWLLNKTEGIIDTQLSFGYSVGRCFIKAQEELIRNFPSMIDNPNVLQDLNVECEKNRLDVDRDLGILQREKPELAIAIKTKTAIRTILNTQKAQVKKFRAGGILDEHESKLLFDGIERNMKSLTFNFPICMEPQPESEMIDLIPWLNGNQELIAYMKSTAEKMDFDIEDILIQEGEDVDGIYLITSGVVRVFGRGMNSYDPDEDNKDPNQKDENGNFTHYDSTYSKENKFSYVHSGGLVGEIGVMLQRESDLTAECETACSAYLIRAEHIQSALEKFINLKNCIWKSIGISVALNQSIAAELLEIGSTSEQRRQYLEPSYFKDMWSAEQFIFDDSSNAVILIFGKIRIEYTVPKGSNKNKEKYQPKIVKAPALIKHVYDEKYNIIDQTFHAIVSPQTGLTPKLLIVPAEVADDADAIGNAIMDRITNFGGKDSVMGRTTGRSSKVGAAPIRNAPVLRSNPPVMIPPQINEQRSRI